MQIRNVVLVKLKKKKVYATILSDGVKQITGGSVQGDDDDFFCFNLLIFLFVKYLCLKAMEEEQRVKHNPENQCQMSQYVNYLPWGLF